MKAILASLLVAAATVGCASPEEINRVLSQKSDGALCLDYMNYPSANPYHSDREREMRRRGLDCWKYGDVAAARARADAGFRQNNEALMRQGQPQQTQQIIIQQQANPNACIQDGGGVFCPNYRKR